MNPVTYNNKHAFTCMAAGFLLSIIAMIFLQQYYILLLPFAMLLFYYGWQHPQVVFFLLIASLPFSFEYNFSSSLGTDIPDEALMLLTSFLFLAYCLYHPSAITWHTISHPIVILLLLHLGWLVLTAATSSHPFLSFKIVIAKTWYVGAFVIASLIVFKNKQHIKTVAIILITSFLLVTVITIVRHASYDFSFATINKALYPFFRNHVNYSSMLVCIIPVSFAIYKLSSNKMTRWFMIAAISLLLTALFFSYARGAWLAVAAGAFTYFLVKRKWLLSVFILAILFTVAGFYWLKKEDRYISYAHDYKTTIFHQDFKEHLVATYQLKDVSTAERFYRWIASIRMIKEKPITGFGPGTFYENYKPYTIPVYKTWVSENKEHSTVHNYFLLLLAEQGIPGLLFFLLLLATMLYYAQHLYNRANDLFYKTVSITIACMVVMIITVNFLSDLIETDKIGSLFFLCLSLLVVTDINSKKLQAAFHI